MMQARKTATDMPTSLRGIANRARRDKKARFGGLYRLLNQNNLRGCFYQLRRSAAPGVDRVTFEQYERELETNLTRLVERLKEKRYRAKLVRRKYIPKPNGKLRPLGIPALEDKLLQVAVAKVLTAIYEQDFLECSWGYRPKRGAREASQRLAGRLYAGRIGWVVEADIKGFFDNISHPWMMRMLAERIGDGAFLRLIGKWLKAGIMEEGGKVVHPATGTPQGGIVSPVLANIYLHYVLDLWFEHRVRKQSQGDVFMIRYADDFVCAFQYRNDAVRFERQLSERLGKFGLAGAPEKTRTLQFNRYVPEPNEAFEFLGFEFRWVKTRAGHMGVSRRTSPKKLRASVKAFTLWIKENRHSRVATLMQEVSRKLRGYWNYYGVRGNAQSMSRFYDQCQRLLYKWLNRRSQRNSYTWTEFGGLLRRHTVPTPRIVEPRFQPSLL
jgi:group II intron reverse transcriptase/maturase